MKNMQKRKYYLDYLRILSTVEVIFLHCFAHLCNNNYLSPSPLIMGTINAIVRTAVPIFCCISGALFLDNSKYISTKDIYCKYIKRIIIAMLFWNFLRAFVYLKNHSCTLYKFIELLIDGDYHMWYMYLIIGFYVSVPILRKITEDINKTRYFLIVSFICVFVLSSILKNSSINALLYTPFSNFNSNLTFGFSFYFVLGWYLSSNDITKKQEKIMYIIGVIGFALTITFTYIKYFDTVSIDTYYHPYMINILFETLALFTFAKKKINNGINNKFDKAIYTISKTTFGMYLIHTRVLKKVFEALLALNISNVYVFVILLALLTIVISFTISFLISKIPIARKYIV